jgi:hypothetical protein
MRSLVDGRVDRLAIFDDGHSRVRELEAALSRAGLEVSVLPRLLHDTPICPPPDVVVVPGAPGQPIVHALDEHPVLRWSEVVVAPWPALVDGPRVPLRIDSLLKAVREALARRVAALAELASGRRAVFMLEPVGPVLPMIAAARTLGTTLVIEAEDARARLGFAHGRFVGGRASDGAGLRTVRGLDALAVALRLHDAEVLVVADEEDEPLGTPIEDALRAALSARPTLAPGRARPRRLPRVLAIPERLEEPDEVLAHAETGPFPALRARASEGRATASVAQARTRPYPAVAQREAAVLLDATRLWHAPLARAASPAPRLEVEAEAPLEVEAEPSIESEPSLEVEVIVDAPVSPGGDRTDVVPLASDAPASSPGRPPRGLLASLALVAAAALVVAAVVLLVP